LADCLENVVKGVEDGNSAYVTQTTAKINLTNVSGYPLKFDILNFRVKENDFCMARFQSRHFYWEWKRSIKPVAISEKRARELA
jgi:hypothetical protein